MKKMFALKASAAIVAMAFAGQAAAVVTTTVNLDAATGAAVHATQLTLSDTNPLVGATTSPNFSAKIGFGVSASQTRYIRLDYTNATLDVAHGTVIGTDLEAATTTGALDGTGGSIAKVAGGAIGDSYVIYQITPAIGISAAEIIDFAVPNLRVTSTGSAVSVSMQLHETAVSAVAGTTGAALLYSKSGNLVTFASALNFALVPATQTAAVETSFKKFCSVSATTCDATTAVVTKGLGTIAYNAVATSLTRAGAAPALTDLLTTADVVVAGDFTAAAAAGSVFIDSDNNTTQCDTASLTGTLNTAKTTATFAVNTTAVTAAANGPYLCYTVNGTTVLPVQAVTARLDVLTQPADTTTASVAAATVGNIAHDGTELQAPWFSGASGWISRFALTNTGSTAGTYTAAVITETGNVCTTGTGASGSIPANGQLTVNASDICTSFSGATRGAVVFTVASPTSSIQGVYNLVNATTGSVSTYPMLRPGTN